MYTITESAEPDEETEYSPKSFLKESCIGSIRYPRIFPLEKGIKKIEKGTKKIWG
ncbi:hypothetical protein [Paenibacillus taichungensis]|uniref:Uncharacterized protein n=1 Tax=Paenibacillus taichungensis TaxID=484184 RepID=A0ABX2MIZ3_9BACL|nr:hypothetical protein [Paenibacillus taichungensis]NUU53567.1 hypothetical protein [Paenibacillus taichungensis]